MNATLNILRRWFNFNFGQPQTVFRKKNQFSRHSYQKKQENPTTVIVNPSRTLIERTPLQCPEESPHLLHLQTGNSIQLPDSQGNILLGRNHGQTVLDVDLSDVPNSEIISRKHALIRLELDRYYIEDLGSSNGTYVNDILLSKGESQEISSGDLISFGKEHKVAFILKIPYQNRRENLLQESQDVQVEIDQSKREEDFKMLTSSQYFQEVKQTIQDIDLDDFWN